MGLKVPLRSVGRLPEIASLRSNERGRTGTVSPFEGMR
jgi:hypothetical protein